MAVFRDESGQKVLERLASPDTPLDELKARAATYLQIDSRNQFLHSLLAISKKEPIGELERDQLRSVAQHQIKKMRESWQSLKELFPNDIENSDMQNPTVIKLYKAFEDDVKQGVQNIVNLIEELCENLLKHEEVQNNFNAKHFSLKMKADYLRYLFEVHGTEESRNSAIKAYDDAWDHIEAEKLPEDNINYLGMVLNMSVHIREVKGDIQAAIDFTKEKLNSVTNYLNNGQAADDGTGVKDSEKPDIKDRSLFIIELMGDNLKLWTGELSAQKGE